eukprot:Skav222976  [mRNA]  locus=scaffold2762:15098:16594:+ [translate_table: standard]
MADSQQRGSSDSAVYIKFKGSDKVIRLDQMSIAEEMMLERGKPYVYVNVDGFEVNPFSMLEVDDGDEDGVRVVSEVPGHLLQPDSQPEHHGLSSEEDGWKVVAGKALEDVRENMRQIKEADAIERVKRFEAKMNMQGIEDDPYWLPSFFEIIEKLSASGLDSPNYQKTVTLLSGCTGLFSEGWLLGIKLGAISCSDIKKESFAMVRENFEPTHFHSTMQNQIKQVACWMHPAHLCQFQTVDGPDLAVVGTPCQPFSRQRVKRSASGSVRAHSKFDTTFKDLIDWLSEFEPKTAVAEQVVGLHSPESSSERSTPMDRLSRGLGWCPHF